MKFFVKDFEYKPENYESFSVTLDWTTGLQANLQVGSDRLKLEEEAAQIVRQHVIDKGIAEGVPHPIQIGSITHDFYLDLTRNYVDADNYVECQLVKTEGIDTFTENARGLTFELLKQKGAFSPNDFFDVPFIKIADDQLLTLISIGTTGFIFADKLIDSINSLAKNIAELIQIATPDIVAPVGVVAVKVGSIIKQSLVVIADLAKTLLLTLALKSLIEQLVDLVLKTIKYLKACKMGTLIQRGCNYLGYSLQSTLLDSLSGLTVLPVPFERRPKNGWEYFENSLTTAFTKGYPTNRDSIRTLMDAIEAFSKITNAKPRIVNNVLQIEQRIYYSENATTVLADNLNLQDAMEKTGEVDTSFMFKRKIISYRTDSRDSNTFDNPKGSGVEYQTELIGDQRYNSIKGLQELQLPFALGTRKNALTWVEKVLSDVARVADNFLGTSLEQKINNRIGVLVVSDLFFEQTKLLYTVNGKQPDNYLDIIGANALFTKYYAVDNMKNASFRVKSGQPTQMTEDIFNELLTNNFVILESGETMETISTEFVPESKQATINLRVKSNDWKNTETVLVLEE